MKHPYIIRKCFLALYFTIIGALFVLFIPGNFVDYSSYLKENFEQVGWINNNYIPFQSILYYVKNFPNSYSVRNLFWIIFVTIPLGMLLPWSTLTCRNPKKIFCSMLFYLSINKDAANDYVFRSF